MRVLITGANRGIGLALTKLYLERTDQVLATARKPAQASELAALQARARERLALEPLDVTDDDSCQKLGKSLGGARIDLLINNAGVGGRFTGLADTDIKQALAVYDTNALGPLRVVRALRPNLRAARGKIVNITSLMGSMADNSSGRAYAYRMSKAALNMASVNLALELKDEGVLSVVVNPGWVKTDMGGPDAPTPVDEAAKQIVALADRLELKDSGKFFHADGGELPW